LDEQVEINPATTKILDFSYSNSRIKYCSILAFILPWAKNNKTEISINKKSKTENQTQCPILSHPLSRN